MKGILYRKSVPRYLLVRLLAPRWPAFATGPLSLISLTDVPEPPLPGPDWVRVRTRLCGICGSDLATIRAEGSPYFSPFTSFPFVLGHEIVGDVVEVPVATGPVGTAAEWEAGTAPVAVGDRVVIEPVLSCAVRGIADACRPCRNGNDGNCERVTEGSIAAGIQIGFCRDTGGGFSPTFIAHRRQIHRVPPEIPDEVAVLIEPFSCAVHAVISAWVADGDVALILGCGTLGLLTIAALRALAGNGYRILATAKYPHQESLALALGADQVLRPGTDMYEEVARLTGGRVHRPDLGKRIVAGGVDLTFDCIGSAGTLDDALRLTRARGTVAVVGMPSVPEGVDWTSIWYKELEVKGAYTYGTEVMGDGRQRTFELAIAILKHRGEALRPLVNGRFPLHDYRRALDHAMHTGSSKSIKTVFEFPASATS